jgi:hypothetical protein
MAADLAPCTQVAMGHSVASAKCGASVMQSAAGSYFRKYAFRMCGTLSACGTAIRCHSLCFGCSCTALFNRSQLYWQSLNALHFQYIHSSSNPFIVCCFCFITC